MVLYHFGFDVGAYRFPDVARWAEDKAVLRRNLEAIRQAATAVILGVEGQGVSAMQAAA